MKHTLKYVTWRPELWEADDPVRPELTTEFKTAPGRHVWGLLGSDGKWKSFMCCARTAFVPKDIDELEKYTSQIGKIWVPYSVWSYEKGAGRAIINEILWCANNFNVGIDRIVTLSPQTEMARKFHLRNDAIEISMNNSTVNFEYVVTHEEA